MRSAPASWLSARRPDDCRAMRWRPVDPLTQPPELGAFLALVKGSITAADDPAAAQKMFDEARLLSPGTLVEEAALRRSIALGSRNQGRRAFLWSPAASMCAASCSRPTRASSPMPSSPASSRCTRPSSLRAVDDIVAGMEPEQQKVIYLQACQARGDRRPSRPHRICLGEGRCGQDRWRRTGRRSARAALFQPCHDHVRHCRPDDRPS